MSSSKSNATSNTKSNAAIRKARSKRGPHNASAVAVPKVTQKETQQPEIFDDELDEDFINNVTKVTTANELQQTVDSFDNPKGIEEDDDTTFTGHKDVDPEEIEKLRKYVQSLSPEDMSAFLAN